VTLVALSASYGAGGSRIGPVLAERLGVPFVDRAIPTAVAEQLSVPLDEAVAHDEQTAPSFIERMLGGFLGSDTGAPTPLPAQAMSGEDFRRATEEVLCRQAETGEGVILGRGGAVVLREHPQALRVRLDGPVERRVRQAMRIQNVDEETARRTVRQLDRAHAGTQRLDRRAQRSRVAQTDLGPLPHVPRRSQRELGHQMFPTPGV